MSDLPVGFIADEDVNPEGFISDEEMTRTGVDLPQRLTNSLFSTMAAGAPGSEMAQDQSRIRRTYESAFDTAAMPPGANEGAESVGTGGLGAALQAIPAGVARAGGELLRTVGQVVNPMTYLPTSEQPTPFVIGPEGIRQMSPSEAAARSALTSPNVPLLPARRTQLNPEGSDAARQLEQLSTLDNISLIAIGGESKVVGASILASMFPQVWNDVKQISRGDLSDDEKRDRINALVMPLALGLRHMHPEGLEALTPNEAHALPEPLEFTGNALPNLPAGATPLRPTPGANVLGPPAPRRARPGIEVPETPPEAERDTGIIWEIRKKNLQTKAQIQSLFPQLTREQAGELRDQAWGKNTDVGVFPSPTIPLPDPIVWRGNEPPTVPPATPEPPSPAPQTPDTVPPSPLAPEAQAPSPLDLKTVSGLSPEAFFDRGQQVAADSMAGRGATLQATAENAFRANPDMEAWQKAHDAAEKEAADVMAQVRTEMKAAQDEGKPTEPVMLKNQKAMMGAGQKAQFFREGLKIGEAAAAPAAAAPAGQTLPEHALKSFAAYKAAKDQADAWWGKNPAPPRGRPNPIMNPGEEATSAANEIRWKSYEDWLAASEQVNRPVEKAAQQFLRDIRSSLPDFYKNVTQPELAMSKAQEALDRRNAKAAKAAPEPPKTQASEQPAPAGIEGTAIAGKSLAEWEAVKDASGLPKGNARAELARWLAVPNQPSRILQALANKKRTREIHAPPLAAEQVKPVEETLAQGRPPATAATPAGFIPEPLSESGQSDTPAAPAPSGSSPTVEEPTEAAPETKAPVAETKAAEPETKPAVEQTKPAPAAPAPEARPMPTEESMGQHLRVATPDVTDQKEAAKFARRQIAELDNQRATLAQERKELASKVLSSRGYNKGRIKGGAKKADVSRYQDVGKEIIQLEGQIEGIRRASAKDEVASEIASNAEKVNDTKRPLIERLGARVNMFAVTGEPVPKDLALALRELSQAEVAKRYPDATKAELYELGQEVERAVRLNIPLDKEFEFQPVLRSLHERRRNVLEHLAFGSQAPFNEFSPELRARIAKYTTQERPSEFYSKDVEKLPSAELESLKQAITSETEQVHAASKALAEKRAAEEAAEKAKEEKLISDAQKVADSLPHSGRKGGPSAERVQEELMRRVKSAIDETIDRSKVLLNRREDGTYVAQHGDSGITAMGEISEEKLKNGTTSFKASVARLGDKESKRRATFRSRAEAEWFIKAMAAESAGRAIVAVPGDGVYALNRSGKGLLDTWLKAKGIDTGTTNESTSRAPSAEPPPGIPKTAADWKTTKEFHGLEPLDKIAQFSPELKRLAESAEKKTGKAAEEIDTSDIDAYVKTLGDKPSMGPGAAASAEFEERPPDPAVVGLSAGNPTWNRMVRGFQNFFGGISQLGDRRLLKRDIVQWMNAADNLPRMAGQEAGNSLRLWATVPEQSAITALMQALKMSGQGLEANDTARLGKLEFAGDPIGYLRAKQTDLETQAQVFLNKGEKIEAQAAIDMANAMKLARERFNALRPLAELAKSKFDRQITREQAAGIDTDYEQWYVPQRHELDLMPSANRPIILGHSRGSGLGTGFKKGKVFEDYASAVEAGFVPRSLSIADLLEHRVAQGERLITRKAFFDSLSRIKDETDQQPVAMKIPRRVITRPDGSVDVQENVPRGYSKQEVIPGYSMAVHNGYSRLIKALTAASQISDSAAVGVLQNIAAVEKHIGLALDTFHASRTLQTEFMLTHRLSLGERQARGRALVEYSPADLDQAVQNGTITQEMADWIRTPQPMQVGGRAVALSPRAVVNLGVKSGLNLARFADVMYRDWLRNVPITGEINRWVFDKMTRAAVANSFVSEFQRVARSHPEWDAKRVGLNVARDINVLFGNLQKESIFRNPSLRALNSIVFLAPQWVEAMARREGRTVMQLGSAANDLAHGRAPRLGSVGRAVGTGLSAYLLATQITNLITRGHLTFSNPEEGHRLDAWIPGGDKGFFVSPLSVFGEVSHDIWRYSHSKPDLHSALSQIAMNKLGNLGRFLAVVASGRDPLSGEKLLGTGRKALAAASQLVPVPIVASAGLKDLASRVGLAAPPPPGSLQRQLTSSAGLKTEPVPSAQNQVYSMADKWKTAQGGKYAADVERRLKEDFGPGDYRSLRMALLHGDDRGAREAYQTLRSGGKTPQTIRTAIEHPHPFTGSNGGEAKFRASLSPQERDTYRQALDERRELARRFRSMLATRKM